jgi:hypothetical protein
MIPEAFIELFIDPPDVPEVIPEAIPLSGRKSIAS